MGLFKKKEKQSNPNFDKKVQWLKNSGHSIKGLFLEWLAEQELFSIVGGEIKRINKAKQKIKRNPQQKLTLKKKVSKMSKKVIDDWVRANFDGQSSDELKKEFLGEINTITSGIKSGNFYKKQDLFGMDDMDDFLAELDEEWDEDESDDYLETSGESFSAWSEFGGGKSKDKSLKKKGESMQTIKKEHLDRLKLSALAESSELAGPVPALSNKIIQLKQKIVDLVNFGESLDNTDIKGIYRFKTMKKDCLNDCKTLTATLNHSNPVLKNKYQGTLSDAIITVITADNELDSKTINELGAEKIINDTEEEINEIKKIDNELGEKVSSTYDDVADEIREKEDDLVFNPAKVKLDNGALPVAEVDEEKCIGCGACAKVCPQKVIHVHECANYIVVKCSNRKKGGEAKKQCEVSCIGCGICEKTCTASAIRVIDNCAVIEESMCLSCGMCAVKCPRHAIHDLRGIFTAVR